MKSLLLSLSFAVSFGSLATHGWAGDLTGRIVINKKLTKKRVTMPAYQLRGASSALEADAAAPVNEYRNVVVFLEDNLPSTAAPLRAELRQQNQRFEPQLIAVPVGSTVSFPNGDPVFHNVFSLSGARKFDLGYYPAGQTRIVKFDGPGIVQVYCHLHPNMYAAIVVVSNRWYARPADDGTFSLSGVPSGKHRLVAWHMSGGFFRRNVEVSEAGSADLVMTIPIREEPQQ